MDGPESLAAWSIDQHSKNAGVKKLIQLITRRLGYDLVRMGRNGYPPDFSPANIEICRTVWPYTMTTSERVNALVDAVRYVVANRIEGALVECGVWKGGSAMAMVLALKELGDESRDIYLYDTFSGMSAPNEKDVSLEGHMATEEFSRRKRTEDSSDWCASSLQEVRANVLSTGYREEKITFVEGKVEATIPKIIPDKIALLRLDTDWYESTKHELVHLFPLVQPNGVVIIDDYGHWQGARDAVDEYFAENRVCFLLNRIDYSGRVGIKSQ